MTFTPLLPTIAQGRHTNSTNKSMIYFINWNLDYSHNIDNLTMLCKPQHPENCEIWINDSAR